jgi:hypothetical protein
MSAPRVSRSSAGRRGSQSRPLPVSILVWARPTPAAFRSGNNGSGAVPIRVMLDVESSGQSRKAVFRCAMSHKLAEAHCPGTVDEKLGCEVGAYVWMQENCVHVRHRPSFSRISRVFWRFVYALLGYPLLSQYVRTTSHHGVPCAYMLLEHIDSGQMLSGTWDKHRACPAHLFCGISNIMLSLARPPPPAADRGV